MDTASPRQAREVPEGQAMRAKAASRSRKTRAAAPATTPMARFVGRNASGSPSGSTSNQARAAWARPSSEKRPRPWTRRWLGKMVSPGASRTQKAISFQAVPGWRRAYSTAVS
jgi:hypothetical protein